MLRKLYGLIPALVVATLLFAACTPAVTPTPDANTPAPVTDQAEQGTGNDTGGTENGTDDTADDNGGEVTGDTGRGHGAIQPGSWSADRTVFTNEWAGIHFELAPDWYALTPEELEETLAIGGEIAFNDGGAMMEMAQVRSFYDFSVVSGYGLPNVMLMYENLAFLGNLLDEAAYFNIVREGLEEAAMGFTYTFLEPSEATIAGETFFVGHTLLEDFGLHQDYYIRLYDRVIIAFIVTYTEDTADEAEAFLASISRP